MSAKVFTCPKCGTNATVQKIQENNFACLNSRCPLHDRLVAHVDVNSGGKVTKIYGWLLESGAILNQRYLIDKLLGKGGFGATYLARDRKMFDKICAIKEIPLIYFDEQEEEFLTRLDHPAIPKLIERFNVNGLHYSVMEYFEGAGLDSLVHKAHSGLPEASVLKIAEPLCNVLSYIHSQKVIHRDLKPENILVGKDNSIALIDFGIAKQYELGQGTRRLARAASSYYSSPEQYQAGKGYTDVKSDIYSFGAILYFLLTGKDPIDALSRAVEKDIEPAPRQINPKISTRVEKIILKAMKMHKSDRYASVPQIKKALFHPHLNAAKTCHQCGVTLREPGNFCPNCGHSTNSLVEKPLEAFVFRSGDRAANLEQFVKNCYAHWEDARWHLFRGDFIDWLAKQPEKALLRKARQFKNRRTDLDRLLNEFLAASKFGAPPQLKINPERLDFQKTPRGKVLGGTIKISNPGQGLLKGEVKSGAKWLQLDVRQFACNGGNICQIGFVIETQSLKPARIYQTKISLDSNVSSTEIPVKVAIDLQVTSTAKNAAPRVRPPLFKQILQPIFFMLMAALTIGQTGANPMLQIGFYWQVLLFAAMGGYWGINQSWLKTIAGIFFGSLVGVFWQQGILHFHQFMTNYFMKPLYQTLALNGSAPDLIGWALLGLYLGGVIALVRVGATRRRLRRYCLLGLPGFTIFIGMAFWGLPYLVYG
jgi:serine/threonine-protein kinase